MTDLSLPSADAETLRKQTASSDFSEASWKPQATPEDGDEWEDMAARRRSSLASASTSATAPKARHSSRASIMGIKGEFDRRGSQRRSVDADVFQRLHRLVPLMWISGNGMWMTAELLYEKPSPNIQFQWFQEPVLGTMEGPDDAMRVTAGLLFAAAFLCCCIAQALGRTKSTSTRTLDELDQDGWIGFWALKDRAYLLKFVRSIAVFCYMSTTSAPYHTVGRDFFWLLAYVWPASVWPALFCSAMVLALLLRAVSLKEDSRGSLFLAEATWLIANTVWLISELLLSDTHPGLRVVAAMVLVIAAALNIRATLCCLQPMMEGLPEACHVSQRGSADSDLASMGPWLRPPCPQQPRMTSDKPTPSEMSAILSHTK
eukprot:s332_g17.t1